MGKTVAQKVLCLPVSAGHAILPAAPGGCFPGALLPSCTRGWKGAGKPEYLVLRFLQSYIRRKTSSYCWLGPATPSFITSCLIDPFLKS